MQVYHSIKPRTDIHNGVVLEADNRLDTPLMICLLGRFEIRREGEPVLVHGGGKVEALMSALVLRHGHRISRDLLLDALWPASDSGLASQSLNSLIYNLHKLLGGAISNASPVVHDQGYYRLNMEAGIGVDVSWFDRLMDIASQAVRDGNRARAASCYNQAITLYRGDLCASTNAHQIIERERLRALYLTSLAWLAEYYYGEQNYVDCTAQALQMLAYDPCREDAHRLVMRSYLRRGERAQALRQFRLCEQILRTEFDAAPEPATVDLFDQIRVAPSQI